MKKFGDFYEELKQNEALNEQFKEAFKGGKVLDFLKENDCEATIEEIKEFFAGLKEKNETGLLDDDVMAQIVGGTSYGHTCTFSTSSCLC